MFLGYTATEWINCHNITTLCRMEVTLFIMKRVFNWYNSLTKRTRDSISISVFLVGFISTICTILGVSLSDIPKVTVWIRALIVVGVCALIFLIAYAVIGHIFKEKIELEINNTPVEISCGDIFETDGYKVIGCDTHFHTMVDDVIISKGSLHGKLVLKHGNENEIKAAIKKAAERLHLEADEDGLYTFPLGSIVRYVSSVDNQTYLMLAMTELDGNYESHTNMAKYEQMLMKMWGEINRVYASNDVALPILGDGITRFDDGPKEKNSLLRCMICTLNGSGRSFNSKIKIVIYGDSNNIPLYELKDVVNSTGRR